MSDEAMDVRVGMLEDALKEIRDNTTNLSASLQKLTVLEERQLEMSRGIERAFQAMKDNREDHVKTEKALGDRLFNVEKEMPLLNIARALVFTFCGGCTMLVLMYVAQHMGLSH